MSAPLLTPDRIALLHDAAKARADTLRREAIDDMSRRIGAVVARVLRRVFASPSKKGAPRGTPFAVERRNAA